MCSTRLDQEDACVQDQNVHLMGIPDVNFQPRGELPSTDQKSHGACSTFKGVLFLFMDMVRLQKELRMIGETEAQLSRQEKRVASQS